jgi:hypothetical protein
VETEASRFLSAVAVGQAAKRMNLGYVFGKHFELESRSDAMRLGATTPPFPLNLGARQKTESKAR